MIFAFSAVKTQITKCRAVRAHTVSFAIMAMFAAALLVGCRTMPAAPGVYGEFPSGAYQWSLTMSQDGRYSLLRMMPKDPTPPEIDEDGVILMNTHFDGEKGRWTLHENKLRLQSEAGVVRTFSVQYQALGWIHLVPDDKSFPVLVWESEDDGFF